MPTLINPNVGSELSVEYTWSATRHPTLIETSDESARPSNVPALRLQRFAHGRIVPRLWLANSATADHCAASHNLARPGDERDSHEGVCAENRLNRETARCRRNALPMDAVRHKRAYDTGHDGAVHVPLEPRGVRSRSSCHRQNRDVP
jgi:hypothetical protein